MKSLLVDALRQANDSSGDRSLSDSGSFDTTREEFVETANDAQGYEIRSNDQELALLEESSSELAADSDFADEFQQELPDADTLTAAVRGAARASSKAASANILAAPFIARHALTICLLLALTFAAGFSLLRMLQFESYLGTEQLRVSSQQDANAPHASESRFPFIAPTAKVAEQDE